MATAKIYTANFASCVYLKVGLDGIGEDCYAENFGPLEVIRMRYLYAGLPALDGEKYLQDDNPLGIALSSLMRVSEDQRESIRLKRCG